jgi:uncharacterized protein (DUF1800 family)
MSAPNQILVAFNRFGLGARGGAAAGSGSASTDPRGLVRAEIDQPPRLPASGDLMPTPELAKGLFAFEVEEKAKRAAAPAEPGAMMEEGRNFIANALAPAPMNATPRPSAYPQQIFQAEAMARILAGMRAEVGFCERLVGFWSNHFAVSAKKGAFVRVMAGAFEREAIRPHVFGRFAEMLKAVEQHPAMLQYLDNQQSKGPNSRAGQRQDKGLNENLAREILELHTLGVNGGYSQADVTNLARIITGWTYAGREEKLGPAGTFVFSPNWHEPGGHPLLGKTYPEGGLEQGEAALNDIARHPATATHIATKLAAHFVADVPPPALVARLAETFRNTDGNLRAMSLALINSSEAWSAPLTKMRAPWEFVMASLRLLDRAPEDAKPAINALNQLGQPLWAPAGPNGFPDTAASWASPEGMKLRLELAQQYARKLHDPPNPRDLLEGALGGAVSEETKQAVTRAETKQQGLALLLMSPEMQRR